jgi:hypothetical protein
LRAVAVIARLGLVNDVPESNRNQRCPATKPLSIPFALLSLARWMVISAEAGVEETACKSLIIQPSGPREEPPSFFDRTPSLPG